MNERSWVSYIEDLHNKASDTKFVWFPFAFLRPNKHEEICFARLVLMAIFFGSYYGIFFCVKQIFFGEVLTTEGALKNTIVAILCFLFWFSLVTAPCWNRRAKKIRK